MFRRAAEQPFEAGTAVLEAGNRLRRWHRCSLPAQLACRSTAHECLTLHPKWKMPNGRQEK